MEKEITIGGIRIHYEETGPENGPALLLMHGWGCSSFTVRSIADSLNDRMHVVSVDLPGHGLSSEPAEVWGVEDFTALMEQFIRALHLENPSLAGHSFGGRVAILLASRNEVNKVMLVDSAGIKPRRNLSWYFKVYGFKLMKALANLTMGKEKARPVIERWRKRRGSADYASSSPVMRAVMSRCVNEDLKGVMGSIKAPVLLVWGTQDTATPLEDAKTMERLIPDAGLAAFDGCGHYSFLDNPHGFRAVAREFFKQELQAGACPEKSLKTKS